MDKQRIAGLASQFHALFAGMSKAYGTYNNIDHSRDADGKRLGTPLTKRAPVTDELWQQHLEGTNGLGIIVIREDSTCMFGALDIDVYADLDPAQIAVRLEQLGIPMIPCRSKSGGVHAHLFCAQPVPANKMQERLRDIAARLGHGNCEVFPKQSRTGERDLGSWINMPYFGGDETSRYAVKANGDPYTMEEFLTAATALRVQTDYFDSHKEKKTTRDGSSKGKSAIPDGPPCLQHLVEIGFPDNRNTALFGLGVYFRKSRPLDWEIATEKASQELYSDPLPLPEVRSTIHSLVRGRDYSYQCSKPPLAQHCNNVVCRSRKFGVSTGSSGFPILSGLRKLTTVPPVWFLDVTDGDGKVQAMEMTTEELLDPAAFQQKAVALLNVVPQMPSKVVWQQNVDTLVRAAILLDPPPADASTEGMFWELVEQFCTGRTQAQTKDEILLGKPWTESGRTYFRLADLLKFLDDKKFREYKVAQAAKVLKMRKDDAGKEHAEHKGHRIKEKFVNLWSVPEFARLASGFEVSERIEKETEKGLF